MPTNPAVRKALEDLADSVHDIGNDNLDAITKAARDAIAGADYTSITIVREDGTIESLAPTDPLILDVDQLQAEFRQGPCVDAALHEDIYISEDLTEEHRWPDYAVKASGMGIAAQMGISLRSPGPERASLNFYSQHPYVFVTDLDAAELFASHAALALGYATATDHFQVALESRKTIGQALGIVMERYQIDETRAFQFLTRTSQTSNVKLREVAADIVAGMNRRNA